VCGVKSNYSVRTVMLEMKYNGLSDNEINISGFRSEAVCTVRLHTV
jgi:hypothetical protein